MPELIGTDPVEELPPGPVVRRRFALRRLLAAAGDEQVMIRCRSARLEPPRARRGPLRWIGNWQYAFTQFWRALLRGEKSYTTLVTGILIMGIAFLLRGMFFTSFAFNDDFGGYAWTVGQMTGAPDVPPFDITVLHRWSETMSENVGYIYGFRHGMLYPMVLLTEIFGGYPNVFASYHMFLSLLQVLCMFLLMRKIFGVEIGLASALLMAIFPIDVNYATIILPDAVITSYTTIALYLFVEAMDRRRAWSRILLYMLSGAVLALAYYSRVYAIFMVGVMGVLVLYRKRFTLWPIFMPIGAGIVFLLFNYPIYRRTGTFIADFNAFSQAEKVFRRLFPVRDVYRYSTFFFQQLLESEQFIPYTFLAIGGCGAMAGLSARTRFLPAIWIAGLFFSAEYFSGRLDEYTMVHKLPRFMTMFSAGLAACGGVLLGRLTSKKGLFYAALFLAGVLVIVALRLDLPIWGVQP